MSCVETICVKIILCDLNRRDEIQNCDTFKLKKKFHVTLLYYIYKKRKKRKKEKKRKVKRS